MNVMRLNKPTGQVDRTDLMSFNALCSVDAFSKDNQGSPGRFGGSVFYSRHLPQQPFENTGFIPSASMMPHADSTELRPQARNAVKVPARFKNAETTRSPFERREKLDGVVEEILGDEFVARLVNGFDDSQPYEARFQIDELPFDERSLLKVGAPFVLTIGYRDPYGARELTFNIYFRRIPARESSDLVKAKERAKSFFDSIKWD